MNIELLIVLLLAAPLMGAAVTAFVSEHERRWTVVLTLLITMSAMGLAFLAEPEAHLSYFGAAALTIDAFTLTVGPALILSRLVLVLGAGHTVAASKDNIWFLCLLGADLVALFTLNPMVLILAEGAAAAILANRLIRRGQRTQSIYLAIEIAILGGALAFLFEHSAPTFSDMPPILGVALVLAGLLRLGVFPLSTGVLATFSRRLDPHAILGVLPVGGILLVMRFSPLVDSFPNLGNGLLLWLKIAAPFAAVMAIAQKSLPRSFGYTLLASHALLAILALDHGQYHIAIAGEFWAAILLSGAGLGAASYLVSLRFGEVDLNRFSGFQKHTPYLSVFFLVLGFSLAGLPGTLQFVAEDFLLNTTAMSLADTLLVVTTISLMGFAVLRMHFRIFYGRDLLSRDFMRLRRRESVGLLAIIAALLLGGLVPSSVPLVSRVRAERKVVSEVVPSSPMHTETDTK